jgi:hypothetical protein
MILRRHRICEAQSRMLPPPPDGFLSQKEQNPWRRKLSAVNQHYLPP